MGSADIQANREAVTFGGGHAGSARVGIIGTYGNGNLGDEAVFVAFLQWLAEHAPGVAPVALCVNPAYVEETYRLVAHPVAVRYAETNRGASAAGRHSPHSVSEPERTEIAGRHGRRLARLRSAVAHSMPSPGRKLRAAQQALEAVLAAVGFFPAQLRVARSLTAAVILGGGQIHDFWDGPLGHPASLFSWALACRLTRTPFAILSIGAVDLIHGLSRRFVRATFRWSMYSTVRDKGSALRLAALGGGHTYPVYPDLAWGLYPAQLLTRHPTSGGAAHQSPQRASAPRIVGLCPMAYRHPDIWPNGEARAYSSYIAALAAFCGRLLREGYGVVLFPTQIRSDTVAVRDVVNGLAPELADRVRVWPVDGIPQLLHCLASVDVVVTSRFHGLLLALLAGRPALSLSYQEKCDALLESLGQRQFGLAIHGFTAEELWERFQQLRDCFAEYAGRLPPHIDSNREKLHEQYQRFFARLGPL